ncbi:MAG: glycosyltransferase [Spirochaetales bacterium]|nr:glycosyltransferase [Spirochaetales bacterium]
MTDPAAAARKKRILHLFPEFKRGGAQINVLRFINASSDDFEHHVAAAPQDDSLQAEYEASGTRVHPLDMTSVRAGSVIALVRLIRELNPHVVHVNGKGAAFYGFVSSLFTSYRKPGRRSGAYSSYRMFHTMRGFHIKYSGVKLKLYLAFERAAAGRMDGTVLVSPSEKDLLNTMIPGLDQSRLFLIPNGIDVKEAALPGEIAEVLNTPGPHMVTLSRLSPQKDLITMVDAFDRIVPDYPDAALHVMGGETPQDRDYAESVKKRIDRSPAKGRIFLWGSVKDAGSLIRHFDLYWSTALFEGLPTAVVEASLCRVPVVGTDCVGNKDLIIPGKTGILTEPGDAGDNARGITEALELLKKGEFADMVNEAETRCLDLSPENNVLKIMKMYSSPWGEQG